MAPQGLSMKPGSIRSRFAYGFLRALKRLSKRRRPISSSSPKRIFHGYRIVKMAADASMASAVGSRRAWSRAMLRKLRCGRRRRFVMRRRREVVVNKVGSKELGFGQTDELRNLVPGGETMDFCSLLDETAHYIKCLTTQVQVMRSIVYFCS
ncbi:transcription factor IBH1-like [Diospyros lotus]|uniref:transcription factor IBH1-like n=1 Tax=Diospyros lotus TaxID=55363 RepID=UPI00225BB0A8|nr:transcription factor IBH1-like [Diospyros lotus]